MLSARRAMRIIFIIGMGCFISACMAFILYSLQESIVFYHTPSELHTHPHLAHTRRPIRIGAQVCKGSVHTTPDGLYIFQLADATDHIQVVYRGLLPSLFAEGRGAVVEGRLRPDGIFLAQTVLAKHDANYRAPKRENL